MRLFAQIDPTDTVTLVLGFVLVVTVGVVAWLSVLMARKQAASEVAAGRVDAATVAAKQAAAKRLAGGAWMGVGVLKLLAAGGLALYLGKHVSALGLAFDGAVAMVLIFTGWQVWHQTPRWLAVGIGMSVISMLTAILGSAGAPNVVMLLVVAVPGLPLVFGCQAAYLDMLLSAARRPPQRDRYE